MKKDAYYFPHFCNARHDRKLKRVQKELGVEGYGIYFMILEVLREQPDFKYPLDDVDLLADEFGTSEQKVTTIISNYKLFLVDDKDFFTSPKLIEYLTPYLERSARARAAAAIRWSKSNANALPEHSKSNASKVKKSKEKKSKENIPPGISEVTEYCLERKNGIDAQKFIDHYEANGWMRGKTKIKSWKACVRTWEGNNKKTVTKPLYATFED